jgi:4-hydroxy-tetrahydrodipicolinate synthase
MMKYLRGLKGIVAALNTIMNEDGSLNEDGIRSLIRFNIEKGVHGLAATIIAGEFYKLTDEERKSVYDIVIDEADGKVPVLAGTSHTGTEPAIELSKYAKDAGADGVVVMPPYFGKAESSLYLYQHYSRIADAVDLPVVIQDSEEYSGIGLPTLLFSRLAKEHSNIFTIKVEGVRILEKIREIRDVMGKDVVILGGTSAKLLLEELKVGADGNMPGGCCLPEFLVEAFDKYRSGDIIGAEQAFMRYKGWLDHVSLQPLMEISLQKETLRLRGIISSAYVRGPRVEINDRHRSALKQILDGLGLIGKA